MIGILKTRRHSSHRLILNDTGTQLPDTMTSDQAQLLLQKLRKLEQDRRFSEAGRAYQQLLEQNPGHPELLWGLGRCMMHFGWRNNAAQVLQEAVAAYPTHPVMTEDVIRRLILLGHPGVALLLCEKAEARFPNLVSISLNKVDALRLLNRHEEAIPLLREVLNTDNPPAGAELRLIACLRMTGRAKEAAQLAAQTLLDCGGGPLEQAGILNEMAHAHESLGEYQSAFESLIRSGEIARRSPEAQSVDAEKFPRMLRSHLASLKKGGFPIPADYSGGDDHRLVFQIGFPRSGTTLVESLLAAHSKVQTSGEAPLWNSVMDTLLGAGLQLDNLLEEIPLQPVKLLEHARGAYWNKVWAEFGRDFDLFVDKQPMNIIFLAPIKLLFPRARIIFCARDPRDVCLSCFSQWFQINPSNIHFLDWHDTVRFYRQVMDYWMTLRPLLADSAYTLQYEKLVGDFEVESRKLFSFLRLNWEDGLLAFQEKNRDRYFHTPSNQAIRKRVEATALPRWRRYPEAIEEVESLLEPIINELGYG
jgi:tetratricopeptide (TPR) repeat protein